MEKIAIITRTFWPKGAAVEEALLILAEKLSEQHEVTVITQADKSFNTILNAQCRGKGIKFFSTASLTTSSSSICYRILELLIFSLYVFFILLWKKPDKIYVATNPPIMVPFLVNIYCWLFGRQFFYHLQDIHPEATEIVTGKKTILTKILRKIDTFTISRSKKIITLTEQMRSSILKRLIGRKVPPIELLENPSVQLLLNKPIERIKGFLYCGNAGRLQRIPLLLDAIDEYIKQGGSLPFVFAGGGVFTKKIKLLAEKHKQVQYLGVLSASDAANLLLTYTYGLMPIDDEITKFSFPSKSSSYVFSGCYIISICNKKTSVANWVLKNNVGINVEPQIADIVNTFKHLEQSDTRQCAPDKKWIDKLTVVEHAEKLKDIILN